MREVEATPAAEARGDRRLARLSDLDPRQELLAHAPGALETALTEHLQSLGQPAYRTGQVVDWIYRTRVDDWSAMTTLPKQLREELAATFRFPSIALEELANRPTAHKIFVETRRRRSESSP